MNVGNSILTGLAGASTVTLINEVSKNNYKDAPRLDALGIDAVNRILLKTSGKVPDRNVGYYVAIANDILLNGVYYSSVSFSRKPFITGTVIGLLAGIGAVWLPPALGLISEATNKSVKTRALTILYYLSGGLVAAAVARQLKKHPS